MVNWSKILFDIPGTKIWESSDKLNERLEQILFP